MTDGFLEMDREVLAVNEAFYRAFANRDVEVMDKLWATAAEVTCIHPGWNAVHGREPVIASWQSPAGTPCTAASR